MNVAKGLILLCPPLEGLVKSCAVHNSSQLPGPMEREMTMIFVRELLHQTIAKGDNIHTCLLAAVGHPFLVSDIPFPEHSPRVEFPA